MDRAAATVYLDRFARPGALAGLDNADTPTGWEDVIDEALLLLGYHEDQLTDADPPTSNALKYRACLRYTALLRLWPALSTQVDVAITDAGISKKRSQVPASIQAQFEAAKAELAGYGLLASGRAVLGRLTLDWAEPSLPGW